jgi:hypothetical protein
MFRGHGLPGLFRQQEFPLFGAPKAIKLPGMFDPDLIAASA